MKDKLTCCFVIVLAFCGLSKTPICAQQWEVGIRAGGNISGQYGNDATLPGYTAKMVPGFTGGAFIHFSIKKWQYVYVSTEVLFAQKGFRYESASTTSVLSFNYISVPLLLGIKIAPNAKVSGRVYAGPLLSWALKGTNKITDSVNGTSTEVNLKIGSGQTDELRNMDWGVLTGAGVDYKLNRYRISVDVRYDQSFSTVSPIQNPAVKSYNQAVSVLFGIGWQVQ